MRDLDALQITQINTRATVRLKSWIHGLAAPAPFAPGVGGECRLLALAPGEWLLISDTIAGQILYEHTTRHVCGQGIAAVNLSQGLAVLRLKGPATRAMLAKGCGLDLHPRHFPVGRCARTRFAQLPIVIDCIDAKPQFDLYVGRSYLPYLISWLDDAAVGM